MSVEKIEIKMDEKIEFDVIVGGKHRNRVTRGVLYEDNFFRGELAISGDIITVFGAAFALTQHIQEKGWGNSFEKYVKFMLGDRREIEEFENFLKTREK